MACAGQGKRQAARKRGTHAEEAVDAAVDAAAEEKERLKAEAVLAFAGRVLDTLDVDIQLADSAATLRLEILLADLQAAVHVRSPLLLTLLRHMLVLVGCAAVCLCWVGRTNVCCTSSGK